MGQRQVAVVFIFGCAAGLIAGYVLMGTAHAVSRRWELGRGLPMPMPTTITYSGRRSSRPD
jgi:hypothetical protein